MTPAAVHYGQAEAMHEQRRQDLAEAYVAHPERFVHGEPKPSRWPAEVWINPPQNSHQVADLVGPATSEREPGTQAVSRARAQAPLDTAEYLATMERAPDQPDATRLLLPKFECLLSQSR